VSIQLTITAEVASDFFAHLAELAAGFYLKGEPMHPVMPEVASVRGSTAEGTGNPACNENAHPESTEDKPKRTRRTAAQIAADNAAAAAQEAAVEQDAGEPIGEAQFPATSVAEPEATTNGASGTPAPAAADSASDEPLNFDTDVAPVVISYVQKKGKPWVQSVLEQFGVARASELAAEQWGELVATLHAEAA